MWVSGQGATRVERSSSHGLTFQRPHPMPGEQGLPAWAEFGVRIHVHVVHRSTYVGHSSFDSSK